MKIRTQFASCAIACLISQFAFAGLISSVVGDALETATSAISAVSGVVYTLDAALKMGLDDDDVQDIREGRVTDRIREAVGAEETNSDEEVLQIMRDALNITE